MDTVLLMFTETMCTTVTTKSLHGMTPYQTVHSNADARLTLGACCMPAFSEACCFAALYALHMGPRVPTMPRPLYMHCTWYTQSLSF